jgi:hypothetical protein
MAINPNLIMILGDYATGGFDVKVSNEGVEEAKKAVFSFNSFANSALLFLQGNHDPKSTKYLIKTGEYEEEKYVIYAINEDDYPFGNGDENRAIVENTAIRLDNYLNKMVELEIHKPVFVVTHVPLHHSSRGDNYYNSYILDVLNKYGDKLDIIYLFGHNHSSTYDDCFGGSINYLKKGSSMEHFLFEPATKTKRVISTPIKFTYLNAGYVGLVRNTDGSVKCNGQVVKSVNTLTMSLFTINDDEIIINRYSSNSEVGREIISRIR